MAHPSAPWTIHEGFFHHYADHVRKTLDPDKARNVQYAILGLVSAVINMLTCENDLETLRDFGCIVFKWIVTLNITKESTIHLTYDQRPLVQRPSSVLLLKAVQILAEGGKRHIFPDTNIVAGESYCQWDIDLHMRDSMDHLLTLLVTYTRLSTKKLAIREQKMSDPDCFEEEQEMGVGLGNPPVLF